MRTLAGERAIRCARLRRAAGNDQARFVLLSIGICAGLLAIPIYIAVLVGRAQFAMPGGSRGTFITQMWADVGTAFPILAVCIGIMLATVWFLPAAGRKAFDWVEAKSLSVELLMEQRRKRVWFRRHRLHFFGILSAVWTAIFIFAVIVEMTAPLIFLSAWGLLWNGPFYVIWGVAGRRGRCLVCARCDHGMRSWRNASSKCTECGADWMAPWGVVIGAKCVKWNYVWWGLASIVGGYALLGIGVLLMQRR